MARLITYEDTTQYGGVSLDGTVVGYTRTYQNNEGTHTDNCCNIEETNIEQSQSYIVTTQNEGILGI